MLFYELFMRFDGNVFSALEKIKIFTLKYESESEHKSIK